MMKALVFLITIIFSSYAASGGSSQYIKIIYSGFTLNIPAAPFVVGHLGGDADSLVFKYSEESGGRYIGFANDSDLYTGNCTSEVFFQKVMGETNTSDCDGAVTAFQKVFSKNSESGTWSSSKHKFYYFIDNKRSSFLFLVAGDGAVAKMESDFLKKSDFREALSSSL